MAQREAYDVEKDELVRSLGTIPVDGGRVFLEIEFRSYDGGPAKLALSKWGNKANGEKWTSGSVGRLDEETAVKLAERILEYRGRGSVGV